MLPRDKGGVVDANFKVYGTSNLRVVDLGVMPLQLACHTQRQYSPSPSCTSHTYPNLAAVVYAIAEKGKPIVVVLLANPKLTRDKAADVISGKKRV